MMEIEPLSLVAATFTGGTGAARRRRGAAPEDDRPRPELLPCLAAGRRARDETRPAERGPCALREAEHLEPTPPVSRSPSPKRSRPPESPDQGENPQTTILEVSRRRCRCVPLVAQGPSPMPPRPTPSRLRRGPDRSLRRVAEPTGRSSSSSRTRGGLRGGNSLDRGTPGAADEDRGPGRRRGVVPDGPRIAYTIAPGGGMNTQVWLVAPEVRNESEAHHRR